MDFNITNADLSTKCIDLEKSSCSKKTDPEKNHLNSQEHPDSSAIIALRDNMKSLTLGEKLFDQNRAEEICPVIDFKNKTNAGFDPLIISFVCDDCQECAPLEIIPRHLLWHITNKVSVNEFTCIHSMRKDPCLDCDGKEIYSHPETDNCSCKKPIIPCQLCPTFFKEKSTFVKHCNNVHDMLHCPYCFALFKLRTGESRKKSWALDVNKKEFREFWFHLLDHLIMKDPYLGLSCDECNIKIGITTKVQDRRKYIYTEYCSNDKNDAIALMRHGEFRVKYLKIDYSPLEDHKKSNIRRNYNLNYQLPTRHRKAVNPMLGSLITTTRKWYPTEPDSLTAESNESDFVFFAAFQKIESRFQKLIKASNEKVEITIETKLLSQFKKTDSSTFVFFCVDCGEKFYNFNNHYSKTVMVCAEPLCRYKTYCYIDFGRHRLSKNEPLVEFVLKKNPDPKNKKHFADYHITPEMEKFAKEYEPGYDFYEEMEKIPTEFEARDIKASPFYVHFCMNCGHFSSCLMEAIKHVRTSSQDRHYYWHHTLQRHIIWRRGLLRCTRYIDPILQLKMKKAINERKLFYLRFIKKSKLFNFY